MGPTYRFQVENKLGQTIAAGDITVKGKRWKWNSDGSRYDESSEQSLYSNSGTLANNGFDQNSGSGIDNTTDKFLGGTFAFRVNAPSSSSGSVYLYIQESTDGGSTWPENGLGDHIATLEFSTSGAKRVTVRI